MTNLIPGFLSMTLYVLAGIFIGVRLFTQRDTVISGKPMILILATSALLIHSHLLYGEIFSDKGLNLGIFIAFSLVCWLIVLMILTTAFHKPVENLGIVLFPMAAFAILLEMLWPSNHFIKSDEPWQLELHILVSIMAYSLFTIAMVQSIVLYIQDKHLRNHRPGGFIRSLPPLQSMEYLLFEILTVAYLLLTVGLLIGALFLEDMFAQHLVHKTVLSIIAWAIFTVLLWGRFYQGWRGRKAILWTIGGFFTLMLAYFGSKMVLELVLAR